MSFLKLIRHSLLIISIFRKAAAIRLAVLFLIYSILVFYFLKELFILLVLPVALISILTIFIIFFLYRKNSNFNLLNS